jgi:biotin-dependent carboxylase-like uncharacterized protein
VSAPADAAFRVRVAAVGAPALVQDGGRPGAMHQGVPPGGALVPELLALANRALGNAWDAPALEAFGELALLRDEGRLAVAVDGVVRTAAAGERLALGRPPHGRVQYVALPGGLDVPRVLGGRGTLPVAHLGGLEGRALRRGDVLVALGPEITPGGEPLVPPSDDELLAPAAPIRVVPGPDAPRFGPSALATLLAAEFRVRAESDRTGVRLAGPALERRDADAALSLPMVRGAIEVTAVGEAIVLGPDHPTTGGYPVLAVVARVDIGRLFALRPGAALRFAAITVEAARAAFAAHRARFGMSAGVSAGP